MRAIFALAALGGVLFAQVDSAAAWSALRCNSNPDKLIRYPGNGAPWPMKVRDNMPTGSLARTSLEDSIDLWNSTLGAYDVLSISGDGYTKCKAPDDAGFGVVGLDDGECSDQLDFDWWGSGANGVRQYWVRNCEVVATTLYANPTDPTSEAEIGDIFSHELGHHMNYAHNWYGVSVMGYGVNMYWYLTSEDQGYIRTRFPSGNQAGADPHLHRTVLLTALGKEIKPDVHSQTTAPDPTCLPGGCQQLAAGSTVSVILTYGNGGDAPTEDDLRISMWLGDYEIGAWLTPALPAHSFNSYEFTATVPEGIPAGDYVLSMEIDSEKKHALVQGPSPARVRDFAGFRVVDGGPCLGNDCIFVPAPPQASTALPEVSGKADTAVVAEGEFGVGGSDENGVEHGAAGCAAAGPRSSGLGTAWIVVAAAVGLWRRRARAA